MKAFVIMFNRLTWSKALCENLADIGCEVIIIDNGSIYPPLLEWYKNCPFKLYQLPNHYGHKSLWQSGIINEHKDENYIVTDHDLDISNVPSNFIQLLVNELYKTDRIKSGLSLKIDDLPKNSYSDEVIKWETKFWLTQRTAGNFFYSDIDTTLAVYSAERLAKVTTDEGFFRAIRSPKEYECKHLPWYNIPGQLSEEEQFYADHIKRDAYWTRKLKEHTK